MKALPLALTLSLFAAGALAAPSAPARPGQAAPAATPKRINRAIAMLEQGQPVYYAQGSASGYDEGRRMAATKADYITYEMEHGAFDFHQLREFMRGLVDGGPTRTGHRTPAVIVTLPVPGSDPVTMRANAWMIQQTLAAGVHGILLVQAESPEAVKIFVESARYPFAPHAAGLNLGSRGSGSQSYAAQIWGVSQNEYLRRADVWPFNPEGEIMLGIKIENPRAAARAEELTRVPGLTFAEWGPGDQAFFLLGRPGAPGGEANRGETQPLMAATRARVLAATKAAGIFFLNACSEDTVIKQIDDGAMICTGGDSAAADKGRAYTKRTAPW
jgi:4-hydroxy-2-oxoheptanedioate aldolase